MTNRPRDGGPGIRQSLLRVSLLLVSLLAMLIAPISAEEIRIDITDEHVESLSYTVVSTDFGTVTSTNKLDGITVADISTFTNPHSLIWFTNRPFTLKNPQVYAETVSAEYTYRGTNIGSGYLSYYQDVDGTNNYIVIVFDSWNASVIGSDKGRGTIGISYNTSEWNVAGITYLVPRYLNEPAYLGFTGPYTLNLKLSLHNVITLTNQTSETYNLTVQKQFETSYNTRTIIKSVIKTTPYIDVLSNQNIYLSVPIDDAPYEVATYYPPMDRWYNRTINPSTVNDDPGDPDDPDESATLTVYIKNSQTGALIANANVAIDALVNGEYYPVTNRTEPSGIFTITLQPTGGGKPNPDGYRLIVTADGYNNPMPEINFTVDDYKNYIHCLLDPIAGGPVNENKTFIDFFVRDMSSNPISGATVKFGKYTLITNSAGYTVFEVDKNNNYYWTVSKSGYGALTGNAVIGNDPRHTINTVLAPIVTPTVTTPIPTSPPIGPTPTMTAPSGEPVSNWLEWFAAHFGMILGGGVEIGKIFMWLCFTVPVGVYVGKEAKAGAAGFMAGAGIVTLFFVLIGWVPIWLVVLLALIIGLLYAKVFNTQDNGGGR